MVHRTSSVQQIETSDDDLPLANAKKAVSTTDLTAHQRIKNITRRNSVRLSVDHQNFNVNKANVPPLTSSPIKPKNAAEKQSLKSNRDDGGTGDNVAGKILKKKDLPPPSLPPPQLPRTPSKQNVKVKLKRDECVQRNISNSFPATPSCSPSKVDTAKSIECQSPVRKPAPVSTPSASPKQNVTKHITAPDNNDSTGVSIVCRLPLERLSGIIDTLSRTNDLSTTSNSGDRDAHATSANSNTAVGNRTLCLYCDRSFSSQKLLAKHTERIHQAAEGRRLSARKPNTSSLLYPGCSHCNNGKTTSLLADELPALFEHLVDIHFDKYFACKGCVIRFSNKDYLQQHLDELHAEVIPIDIGFKQPSKTPIYDKRKKKSLKTTATDTSPTLTDTSIVIDASTDCSDTSIEPDKGASTIESTILLRSSRRQQEQARFSGAGELPPPKTSTPLLRKKQIISNESTPLLSRLGIAQNRSPRTRRGGMRNHRNSDASSDSYRSDTPAGSSLASTTASVTSTITPRNRNKSSRSSTVTTSASAGGGLVDGVAEIVPTTSSAVRAIGTSSKVSVDTPNGSFDENFYESVCTNVRLNLSCHLDGKRESGSTSPCPVGALASNIIPTVSSTLVKTPLVTDPELHEATSLATVTAFPTLLTAHQYGVEPHMGKIKKPITKNSWKWKWDSAKKYKWFNEGGKMVKKIKPPAGGLRDLSRLDMWTQLSMRMRHEQSQRIHLDMDGHERSLSQSETAKLEKQKLIDQLSGILDRRILPQINLEQNDQRVIKCEPIDEEQSNVTVCKSPNERTDAPAPDDLLSILRLSRVTKPVVSSSASVAVDGGNATKSNLILSGEWARPRCYICYGCGAKFETVKNLEDHQILRHPHVYTTHYEIVGKELIEGNLFRHFYIPSSALNRHTEYMQRQQGSGQLMVATTGDHQRKEQSNILVEDSMDSITSCSASISKSDSFDMDTNSRNSKESASTVMTTMSAPVSTMTSFAMAADASVADAAATATPIRRACTKCKRLCSGRVDLYRHMLDCSGDYAWFLAKKRHNIKYRYFGSRKRKVNRTHYAHRRPAIRPKKEECSGETTPRTKEPQTPKPRPSDAESIQRMLANLPAKRACRQIIPNLLQKRTRKLIATANTAAAIRAGTHHKQILVKQTSTTGGGRSTRSFKYVTSSPNAVIGKNLNMRKKLLKHQSTSPTTSASCSSLTAESTTSGQRKTRSSLNNSDSSTATETQSNPEKSDDFINTLRSKTRRVVSKITSSFRRPLKRTRLLRPLTTKVATDKPQQAASTEKVDVVESVDHAASVTTSKPTSTNSRATFLRRALSFRKSRRKTVETTSEPDKVNEIVPSIDEPNEKTVDDANKEAENKEEQKITDTAPKKSKGKTFKKLFKSIRKNCRQKVSAASPDKDVQPYVRVTDVVKKGTFIAETNAVDQLDPASDLKATEKLPEDDLFDQTIQPPVIESKIVETIAEENEPVASPPRESAFSQIDLDLSDNSTELADESPSAVDDESKPLQVPPQTPHSSTNIKTPPSAKRRVRKLNDCIAMLTGKLQEKLGVPFLENDCNVLMQSSVRSVHQAVMEEEDNEPIADVTESTLIAKAGAAGDSSVEGTPKKRRGRKPKNLVMVQQRPIFNLDMPAEFPVPPRSFENIPPPDIVLPVAPVVERMREYYDEQEQPINLVIPKARHASTRNVVANLPRAPSSSFNVSIEPSTSRFAMMGYQPLNLPVTNVVAPPVDCSPSLPEISPAIVKYADRTTTSELRKLRKTKITPSSSPPVPVAEQLLRPIGLPMTNVKAIENIMHSSANQALIGGGFLMNVLPGDSQHMPDNLTIKSTANKRQLKNPSISSPSKVSTRIDNLSRIIDEVASNYGIEIEETTQSVVCATQPIVPETEIIVSAVSKRKSKCIPVNLSAQSDASKVTVSEHIPEDLAKKKSTPGKRKPKTTAIVEEILSPAIPDIGPTLANLGEAKVVEDKPTKTIKDNDSVTVSNLKPMEIFVESVLPKVNLAEKSEMLSVCDSPAEGDPDNREDLSIVGKDETAAFLEPKVQMPKKRGAAKKKTETPTYIPTTVNIVEELPKGANADAVIVDSKKDDAPEPVTVTNVDVVGTMSFENNAKPTTKTAAKRNQKSMPTRGEKSKVGDISDTVVQVPIEKTAVVADGNLSYSVIPESVLSTDIVKDKLPDTECQADVTVDANQSLPDKPQTTPKKGANRKAMSETKKDEVASLSEALDVLDDNKTVKTTPKKSAAKRKPRSVSEDQTLADNANKESVAEPVSVVQVDKDLVDVTSITATNINDSEVAGSSVENVSIKTTSKKNANRKQKSVQETTPETAIASKVICETDPYGEQVDTVIAKLTPKKIVNRKKKSAQEVTPEIATNESEVTGESSEIVSEKTAVKKTNNIGKQKQVQEIQLETSVDLQDISEPEQTATLPEPLKATPTRAGNRKHKPVQETPSVHKITEIPSVIDEPEKKSKLKPVQETPSVSEITEIPLVIDEPEKSDEIVENVSRTTPKKTTSRKQKEISSEIDKPVINEPKPETVLLKTTPKSTAGRKPKSVADQAMSSETANDSNDTSKNEPIGVSCENVLAKSTLKKTANRKQKAIQEASAELPIASKVISVVEPTDESSENVPAKTTPKKSVNRKQIPVQEIPSEIDLTVFSEPEPTSSSIENIPAKTTPKKIAVNRKQKPGTVDGINSEMPVATKELSKPDSADETDETASTTTASKKTVGRKPKSEISTTDIHDTPDNVVKITPVPEEDTSKSTGKSIRKPKVKSNQSDAEKSDTEPIVLEVKDLPKKGPKVDNKKTTTATKTAKSFDKSDNEEVVLEVKGLPTESLSSKATVPENLSKSTVKSDPLDIDKADTEKTVLDVKELPKKETKNTSTAKKKAKVKSLDKSDNEEDVSEDKTPPKEDLNAKTLAAEETLSKTKSIGKLPRKSKVLPPTETKVFDSSEDEELLPWDPEIGFVSRTPTSIPGAESNATPDELTPKEINTTASESPAIMVSKPTVQTVTKPRKRRKNELAKIIADQLLESFKEVDQSRIEELKILHDLSIESTSTAVDDLLLSASLSATPPPKRKTAANIASDALVDLDTSFEEVDSESEAEIAKGNMSSSSKKPIEETTAKAVKSKMANKKVTTNEKKAPNKSAIDVGKLDHTISPDSMKRKTAAQQSVTKKLRRNVDQKTDEANSDVDDSSQTKIVDKPVGKAAAGRNQGRGDKISSTGNENFGKTAGKPADVGASPKAIDVEVKAKRGAAGRRTAVETTVIVPEKTAETTDIQKNKRRAVAVSNSKDELRSIGLTTKFNEFDIKSKPSIPMKITARGRRSTICGRSTITRPSVDTTTVTLRETPELAERVKFDLLCETLKTPDQSAEQSKQPISAIGKTSVTEPLLDDKLLKAKIVVSSIRLAPVKPIVLETKTIPSVEVAPTLSTTSVVVGDRKSPPTISTVKPHGKIFKKGRGKRSPKKSSQQMPALNVNDMVAQIINDFTTSTIDSPRNNSPVVFGELTKTNLDLLNRTARNNELFNSLKYSNSKTDMEKLPEIGIATKQNHRPSYDHALMGRPKAVENLLQMDRLAGCMKSPMRAPFMSPRWEPSSDADRFDSTNTAAAAAAAAAKLMMPPPSSGGDALLKEPVLQKLWPPVKTSLIDEPPNVPTTSAPEKSLFQNVKDKTKKLFSKMSKRKSKKSSDPLMGKKVRSTQQLLPPKRPLLRPSILSATNVFGASVGSLTAALSAPPITVATDVDSCLKKLESSSLFVGKSVDFTENSLTNIFSNDKAKPVDLTSDNLFEKPQTNKPIDEFKLFAKEGAVAKKVMFPETEPPIVIPSKVTPQKINRRRQTTTTRRMAKVPLSKPLTPPPNRSKRTISPQPLDNLNTAFIQDRSHAIRSTIRKSVAMQQPLKSAKLSSISPRILLADGSNSPSSSSGDTFLSQMVDKIRSDKRDQKSESEEDLCLAAIAKSLNNKIMNSDEFNNELDSPPAETTARPPLFVTNDNPPSTPVRAKSPSPPPSHASPATSPPLPPPNVNETNQSGMDRSDIDLDENTNTDLIDMDLEDCASVYTSFSIDTSFTVGGTVVRRKKRRQRKSIIYRKAKKFLSPDEVHLCDICNKTFRSVGGLSSHKMTLSHISKLSEREFLQQNRLNSSSERETNENGANMLPVLAPLLPPPAPILPTASPLLSKSPMGSDECANVRPIELIEAAVPIGDTSTPSATSVDELVAAQEQSSAAKAAIVSPIRTQSSALPPPMPYLCQSGIEPISSPEQIDLNYDRYTVPARPCIVPAQSMDNSRLALSQEERLFYECCSMLKGSDRSIMPSSALGGGSGILASSSAAPIGKFYPSGGARMTPLDDHHGKTKPVTPKSNEQYSSYLVPPEHKGVPKIDINQFSDISSDSNPAYSCPQVPSQSETVFANEPAAAGPTTSALGMARDHLDVVAGLPQRHFAPSLIDRGFAGAFADVGNGSFLSHSLAGGPDRDDGYHLAVKQRSPVYVQRAYMSPNSGSIEQQHLRLLSGLTQIASLDAGGVADGKIESTCSPMDSPLHSTSSQSSTISKPRTKAAMKGYENFKVSIPTTGLDMQQALNRSPNPTGCKLAALADIALGNDVPHAVGLMRSPSSAIPTSMLEPEARSRSTSPASRPITPDIPRPIGTRTPPISNDDEQNTSPVPPKTVVQMPTAKTALKKKAANRLGFKKQKKKVTKARKPIEKPTLEPRDVYDFEDSHDSMDVPIVSLSHVRSKVASITTELVEDSVTLMAEQQQPPLSLPKTTSLTLNELVPLPLQQTSTTDELNTAANSPASSYSDRDDFNYDSVSESESSSASEPKPDIASRPASRISNRSAKSINNLQKKCLIMGRIFKTAKKAEVAVAADKATREPAIVKKPIPKQELDKLFDSLRGSESIAAAAASASTSTSASTKPKSKQSDGKVANSSINGQVTATPSSSKPSESKEEKAAKRDAARRSRKPREVANMEAEWGMSMEQIIDLIGVGQRKTQRRCAANKQRTFAETWSSDEYEEFHSTKDIIALIQEAEVKARRARSRSVKNSTKKTAEHADDELLDGTNEENAVDEVNAAPATTAAAAVDDHSPAGDKKKKVKMMISDADPRRKPNLTGKEKQAEKDKENKQSTAPAAVKDDSDRKKKPTRDETVVSVTTSAEQIGGKKPTTTPKTKKATTFADGVESGDDTDIDSEWSKSAKRSKIKNRRRTIAFREDDTKDTTNTAKSKRNKTPPPPSSRKFDAAKSSSSSAHNNSSPSSGQPKATKCSGGGDPRPMARRKRIASEMLYYWSSSSDEEFGRIKPRENYDDDNLEQHGWIVGDSHKKLVTLLAHAKGKKIEDCGVKEAIHKKKS